MTRHELFPSIDAMLAPETLTALTGLTVQAATVTTLGTQDSAYSGSAISAVELDGAGVRLLLKRTSPAWDYFMRVTDDAHGRETLVWTSGLLDRLPPQLVHPYLACARDGDDAWAILMRDVGPTLLSHPGRAERTADDHDRILAGLAAFHATFWAWEGDTLAKPACGFCEPRHHYHVISPVAARTDPDQNGVMPRIVRDGWARLGELLPNELADRLLDLTNDPTPLVTALARFPQTVVHGDFRTANIGLERGVRGRPVSIDWALVGQGVAGLDLAWYLTGIDARSSMTREQAIMQYHGHLQHLLGMVVDDDWWSPMLELSLLGGFIRCGWIAARAIASNDPARRAQGVVDLAWWQAASLPGLASLAD